MFQKPRGVTQSPDQWGEHLRTVRLVSLGWGGVPTVVVETSVPWPKNNGGMNSPASWPSFKNKREKP